MKSKFLLAMSAGLLFCSLKQKAQVSSYSFSQTMSTYGASTIGTMVGGHLQDDIVTNVTLPFPFTFNGTTQTTVNVCSNGYLSFNPLTGAEYNAISSPTTQNVISALGDNLRMGSITHADLVAGSNTLVALSAITGFSVGDMIHELSGSFSTNPSITSITGNTLVLNLNSMANVTGATIYCLNGVIYQDVSGTAPNRVCEFEFINFSHLTLQEAINFKVRLYETSNNIEFLYGAITTTGAATFPEVGLKGLSNTDFNSRSVIAPQAWAASSAATAINNHCEFDLGSVPANGLSYLWSPPSCTVPVLAITSASATICPGEPVELTASGATTYSWTNGPATAQYTVTPSATTEYTLVGANGTCTSSVTHTQQVTPLPVLAITSASATICPGEPVELTASGATTYSWTNGPATAQYTVTPSATTEYTLVGANGTCTSSITHTQQVTPAPVLAITSASATICPGEPVELTASGATSYSWTNGPTTAQHTVTPSATTEYTLVGSNGTCTSSVTHTQQVTPLPVLAITSSSASICPGEPVELTASGATTYSWTNGPATAQYTVTPSATTEYTLVGANGTCTSSVTHTQQVTPAPVLAVASASASICPGESVELTASGAATYSWTNGPAIAQYTVTPSATTEYTVVGANGTCTSSITYTQQVTPAPVLAVTSASASICPGESVELTASGATTYSWTNGPAIAQYTVTPSATTEYTVVGANGTCTSSITFSQQVTPIPALSISQSAALICSGQSATLTASGATTYSWTNGPTTAQYSITPDATTEYTLVGANGTCTSSITYTQQVAVTPTITISQSSTVICAGQSVTLTASGATTYSWNGVAAASQTVVSPASVTLYSVSGSNGTCTASQTITQNVNAAPSLTFAQTSTLICAGESVTLTASGATSYSLDGVTSTSQTVVSPTTTTTYVLLGSNGTCTSTASLVQNVEDCNVTGIQKAAGNAASDVLAYPNPFSTALNVQNTAKKDMNVTITDALGKVIFKATVKAQSTETISADSLNAGLYFISVNGTTKKLIKQ